MFPEGKIIEIFSMCDDFSKVFDTKVENNAITDSATKKRKYHRDGRMPDSEVMTILILFHNSDFIISSIISWLELQHIVSSRRSRCFN